MERLKAFHKTLALEHTSFRQTFWSVFLFFLPSFVSSYIQPEQKPSPIPIRRTAWLDGLRGWAAMLVYLSHFFPTFHKRFHDGWSVHDNYRFVTLPFIRIISAGVGMTNIFFVVSGCAISLSAIEQIQQKNIPKAWSRLSSSIFRRPMRLFFAPFCFGILYLFVVYFGWQEAGLATYSQWKDIGDVLEHPDHHATFSEQFWDWYATTKNYFYIICFDENRYNGWKYVPPAWSLVAEFRLSMIVFCIISAVSPLTTLSRYAVYISTYSYCLWYANTFNGTLSSLFISGLILAEIDTMRNRSKESKETTHSNQRYRDIENNNAERHNLLAHDASTPEMAQEERSPPECYEELAIEGTPQVQRPRRLSNNLHRYTPKLLYWTYLIVFFFGVFVISAPLVDAPITPGYVTLYEWCAPKWWVSSAGYPFCVIGAKIIVFTVSFSEPLQVFFSCSFSRYLGRISFAVYLVHIPCLVTIGVTIMPTLWKITGGPQLPMDPQVEHDTGFGFVLGEFISWLIVTTSVVWIADVFTRACDEPGIKLAKKLENWMKGS